MHLELVVPAIFPGRDAPAAPALELLLARGRRMMRDVASPERWLCRAFGLGEARAGNSAAPSGTLTALAHGVDPGAQRWVRADPVHLRAARDRSEERRVGKECRL